MKSLKKKIKDYLHGIENKQQTLISKWKREKWSMQPWPPAAFINLSLLINTMISQKIYFLKFYATKQENFNYGFHGLIIKD